MFLDAGQKILEIFIKIWDGIIEYIPNILTAVVIFLIGWIIAKVLAFIIRKVLVGLKVDVLAQKINDIDFISNSSVNIVPSALLSKLVYYIVLLVFGFEAAQTLGIDSVTQLVKDIIGYIPQGIAAIIVLVIGLLLADFLKNIVLTTTQSLGIPSAKIIASLVFYFIFIMAIITAVAQMGFKTDLIKTNLSVIIAGIVFAFALGYGLASRQTMSNYLATFYTKDKFQPGDIISIDNVKGEIVSMDNSSVVLRSENKKIIIPLNKLNSEKVELMDA